MNKITVQPSTVINTESTTVVTMDKETCVQLIHELSQNLADVGTGHLVLRTSENKFIVFKVDR